MAFSMFELRRVVISQLAKMVVERILEQRSYSCSDPFVEGLAPLNQDRVIGDFQRKRVLEGVLDIANRGLLVDELA